MTGARIFGIVCALLLAGCQQTGSLPIGDAKRLAELGFVPTKAVPAGEWAMGATPTAELATWSINRTIIAFRDDGCEHHQYRTIDGQVSAETLCGDRRYVSTGRWSIRDDGADCMEWDNTNWDGGCTTWRHLGDGRFSWVDPSGLTGESEIYIGNLFDL